jgi:hypothetical protein
VNLGTLLVHVPPFRHGDEEHSLMSLSQRVPLKPGGHTHVKLLTALVHVPPLRHGDDAHSLMSLSQRIPLKPGGHMHANDIKPSKHVPPFMQGEDTHSSAIVWSCITDMRRACSSDVAFASSSRMIASSAELFTDTLGASMAVEYVMTFRCESSTTRAGTSVAAATAVQRMRTASMATTLPHHHCVVPT